MHPGKTLKCLVGIVRRKYTGLKKQVFNLTQRQREADIHHYYQANNLGRSLEIAE